MNNKSKNRDLEIMFSQSLFLFFELISIKSSKIKNELGEGTKKISTSVPISLLYFTCSSIDKGKGCGIDYFGKLTIKSGVSPLAFLTKLFATISAIISRASNVALPICGVMTTLSNDLRPSVIFGSNS